MQNLSNENEFDLDENELVCRTRFRMNGIVRRPPQALARSLPKPLAVLCRISALHAAQIFLSSP